MQMRPLAVVFSLLVGLMSFVSATASAQQEKSLFLVWDATASVSCALEIQFDDGPWNQIACPPGTVIIASPASSDEAEARSGFRTVGSTGDQATDQENIGELVTQLRSDIAYTSGDVSASGDVGALGSSCDGRRRNMTGSYVVGSSDAARTYWALGYTINTNCTVTAVRDRDKVGPSNSGRVTWANTCTNGSGQCSFRNIRLYSDYTSTQSAADSYLGNEYRNVANLNCGFCTWYYGIWSFE